MVPVPLRIVKISVKMSCYSPTPTPQGIDYYTCPCARLAKENVVFVDPGDFEEHQTKAVRGFGVECVRPSRAFLSGR